MDNTSLEEIVRRGADDFVEDKRAYPTDGNRSLDVRLYTQARDASAPISTSVTDTAETDASHGDPVKLRADVEKYGAEWDTWKEEIEKKIAAIYRGWRHWPKEKQYLENRLERLVPDLDQQFARMNSLAERADESRSALKSLERCLKAYKGADGRELLVRTRKDLALITIDYMDELLLAEERNELVQIVGADEMFFRHYLSQSKPTISVFRGDGRGINSTSLVGFTVEDIEPGGDPDVSFRGVVEHTHTNTLKNGMVSTTSDRTQAMDWALDKHSYGLLFEIQTSDYIDVEDLLRRRNFRNRYAAQLEILIPGAVPAADVVSVTLYRSSDRSVVARVGRA